MNILVDRHHAGLLNSLQLLFEDRLGMDLYVPIGQPWWDGGYWLFGQAYGDDRLARQFLDVSVPEWEYMGGYSLSVDPHYPDRLIRGVTLEEARRMPWALVLASVQDNQAGYARFAHETGAEYGLQVGNVNQDVDWQLDPLALVSTGVPMVGRGVRYHPEFHAEYREPVSVTAMASFVNCFPSTPCHALTEGLPVAIHGIDGPDGNVTLASDIEDIMAASGWGWHDKVQGDGYGFVIFGWAATGRPLIGHGQHYRGTVAEPFWQDGVTCLDLDRHSPAEVWALVQSMSATEHRVMCQAIRAEFDAMVDFAADAEAVRDMLSVAVAA